MIPEIILGLDYGTHRIGVALANTISASIRPLPSVTPKSLQDGLNAFCQLREKWAVNTLVYGWPLDKLGNEQPITKLCDKFIKNLQTMLPECNLQAQDERYTTIEAKLLIDEHYAKRSLRKATELYHVNKNIDKDNIAACIILRDYCAEKLNLQMQITLS